MKRAEKHICISVIPHTTATFMFIWQFNKMDVIHISASHFNFFYVKGGLLSNANRHKFVLPSSDSFLFRTFSVLFVQRFEKAFYNTTRRNSASCGQRNRIMGISPALLALTGKYHYPHTFHCRLWMLSKGL